MTIWRPPEDDHTECCCEPPHSEADRAAWIQISIYLCGFVRSTFNVSEGIRFV